MAANNFAVLGVVEGKEFDVWQKLPAGPQRYNRSSVSDLSERRRRAQVLLLLGRRLLATGWCRHSCCLRRARAARKSAEKLALLEVAKFRRHALPAVQTGSQLITTDTWLAPNDTLLSNTIYVLLPLFRLLSGELEADILAGELLVHSGVGGELVLNVLLISAVEVPRWVG